MVGTCSRQLSPARSVVPGADCAGRFFFSSSSFFSVMARSATVQVLELQRRDEPRCPRGGLRHMPPRSHRRPVCQRDANDAVLEGEELVGDRVRGRRLLLPPSGVLPVWVWAGVDPAHQSELPGHGVGDPGHSAVHRGWGSLGNCGASALASMLPHESETSYQDLSKLRSSVRAMQ
jgi:hypothetical protein